METGVLVGGWVAGAVVMIFGLLIYNMECSVAEELNASENVAALILWPFVVLMLLCRGIVSLYLKILRRN